MTREQAAGWQPIETAPEDRPVFTFQQTAEGAKYRVARFWSGLVWQDEHGNRVWPTHWQPLPAPPGQEQP